MSVVRPARSTEAGQVGAILSEFVETTEWMPKLHSRAEDVAHAGAMIERGWVTVFERDGVIEGFVARDGEELDALYVAQNARNRQVGSALLDEMKSRVGRLVLWTFQANMQAQAFYKRHGFVERQRTDGAGNDEQMPDVQLEWVREHA